MLVKFLCAGKTGCSILGLAGLATAMALPAAYAQSSAFDFIAVVDESGSMFGLQQFTGSYAVSLESSLTASGASAVEFGLVGYGSGLTGLDPQAFFIGTDGLGSAAEFQAAANSLVTTGFIEDGYQGINFALDTVGLPTTGGTSFTGFNTGARRNIILVTDEDRDINDSSLTREAILSKLVSNNVVLTTIVSVSLATPDGTPLVAVISDGNGGFTGYVANTDGSVSRVALSSSPISATFSGETTVDDYATLALETGGAVVSISSVNSSSFTAIAQALTEVLEDVAPVGSSSGVSAVLEDAVEDSAPSELRTTVRNILTAINTRIRNVTNQRGGGFNLQNAQNGNSAIIGLSGGDLVRTLGFWADGSYSRLKDTSADSAFTGHNSVMLFGLDTTLSDNLVVGAVLGAETVHVDTSNMDVERSAKGGSATAYAGYMLTDSLQATAQLGFGRFSNDVERLLAGMKIDGDTKSTRYLTSIALTKFVAVDKFDLSFSAGYNWSKETFDSYTTNTGANVDSVKTILSQITVGSEATYAVSDQAQIFAGLGWEVDLISEQGVDPNGGVVSAGWRYQARDNLTVGLLGTAAVMRHDERQLTLGANLRLSF